MGKGRQGHGMRVVAVRHQAALGSHLQLMDRSCFLDILVSVVAFRFGLLQGTCELWFADGFGNNSFN